MSWTEEAFWACSWQGFLDAWTGYSRFVLGHDPDGAPMSRREAEALDQDFGAWQASSTLSRR